MVLRILFIRAAVNLVIVLIVIGLAWMLMGFVPFLVICMVVYYYAIGRSRRQRAVMASAIERDAAHSNDL